MQFNIIRILSHGQINVNVTESLCNIGIFFFVGHVILHSNDLIVLNFDSVDTRRGKHRKY